MAVQSLPGADGAHLPALGNLVAQHSLNDADADPKSSGSLDLADSLSGEIPDSPPRLGSDLGPAEV